MRILVVALLLLAACDSPSLGFQGIDPTRVEVARFDFSVRVRGTALQSVRVNPLWPPPAPGQVLLAAAVAMGRAAGCPVDLDTLKGDAAVQSATLACTVTPRPAHPAAPRNVTCDVAVGAVELGPTGEVYGVDCFLDQ